MFSFDVKNGKETTVHSFDKTEGDDPAGVLTKVDETFYGTTAQYGAVDGGGTTGQGTVYALNPRNGKATVPHVFAGGADGATPLAGVTYFNGKLFGTTSAGGTAGQGTIYAIDLATGSERVVYSFQGGEDGAAPSASLIAVGSTLYGVASAGGGSANCSGGCGTAFSFTP